MAKRKSKRKISSNRKSKKKSTNLRKRLFQLVFIIGLGISFLFGILTLGVWSGILSHLPSVKELQDVRQKSASLVYAADGKLMGKYYTENRQTIENDGISPYAREALIATEDNRFFEHNGFDLISLGRVFVKTILMGDLSQGGGSTISQQLAKNLYPRKNFYILSLPINKIREIFIASRLEQAYSKDDILALYLNTVPFGEDVYGIEAASHRFFNKRAVDLNLPESATLIGLLAANTSYSPRLHPELSMQRRNVVISRMVVQGFIPEKEAELYKKDTIVLNYTLMDANRGIAPYFRSYLYKRANQLLSEIHGDKYNLKTDGLKIFTTINEPLQQAAEDAVAKHMLGLQREFDNHWKNRKPWEDQPEVFENALQQTSRYQSLINKGLTDSEIKKQLSNPGERTIFTNLGEQNVTISTIDSLEHYLSLLNAGFLAVNPQNGAILAWVGGLNYKYLPYDHVLSKRQVGSTFKPIVYATALEQGINPCKIYKNKQRIYPEYDDWSPANSEENYEGFYTLKGGLVNSVNTVAAEVVLESGIENVIQMAQKMGISSDLPTAPSIALGTPSLSLWEMVKVYTTFASYGKPAEPFGILRIEDSEGKILYEHQNTATIAPAMQEETALLMNEILQGVVNRGTARSLRNSFALKCDLAGKTGTTQNNADGWFIGYTPNIVAGVWVGAEQPSIHFRTTNLGQGAHMALPIFGYTMREVVTNQSLRPLANASFRLPSPELLKKIDCLDYYDDKPKEHILELLFDLFSKPDSLEQQLKETTGGQTNQEKKEKGFFKKLRQIFKSN